MSDYIVCHKKRNNPRIDIRICEKKCPEKANCQAFLDHGRIVPQNTPLTPGAPVMEREAA